MKAIKSFFIALAIIITLGIFSTASLFASEPPNTYKVVTFENDVKITTYYSTLDGGVVEIRVGNYD
ncbi:MAG: hypothetical protein HY959_09620 [Ignavibacteriae bacterium]|nr:hypothetical protein [Ignavibacteriota bacterium]